MPKYFRSRRAIEVRKFLEAQGFIFKKDNGDDSIYERTGFQYTIKIPARDNEEIPDGTMSNIKKCLRMCGVDPKAMLGWWKKNGYGD